MSTPVLAGKEGPALLRPRPGGIIIELVEQIS